MKDNWQEAWGEYEVRKTQVRKANSPKIRILRGAGNDGVVNFGDLISEDDRSDIYTREIEIPRKDIAREVQKRYEEVNALPSTEPVPKEAPERRTVEFWRPLKVGRQVDVEVWTVNGEESYKGGATVLELDFRDSTRSITLQAPIARGEYIFLVGDVKEYLKVGRFEEVEDTNA